MLSGVLFLVFFVQFVSIMLSQPPGPQGGPGVAPASPEGPVLAEAPPDEITRRMFEWMAFSVVVGGVGGILIARVISAPVTRLAEAADRIGKGDLNVRVSARGSREMVELATTFNRMAEDLQHAETLRQNLMDDVSHELRTPLAVLEGNLRAAMDHVYPIDEAEIANLYGQVHHLIKLVNDLRELALAESHHLPLDKQPVDLNAIVADTLQALEPIASESGVRLIDRTAGLPKVFGRPLAHPSGVDELGL
jgi:signal transduction histidine kinase